MWGAYPPTKGIMAQRIQIKNTYCVTHEERNKNIVSSMARIKKRIQPGKKCDEPIAIVAYGPSLNDTWESIKDFKYVMTMSGSHKFLVDRGIIPTHHIEVDPRPHKAHMLGTPQPGVQYLIAADCAPNMFDLLEGYDVTLWQVLSEEQELQDLWEVGDYAIAGGIGVGARSLVMAKFLGFSDFHVFGMDGCLRDDVSHAALHTNAPTQDEVFEVEETGKRFKTTSAMLGAVAELGTQMDAIPNTSFTFYGNGLVQWCATRYQPKVWKGNVVPVLAVQKMPLSYKDDHPGVEAHVNFHPSSEPIELGVFNENECISAEYRDMNYTMHKDNGVYGAGGKHHIQNVIKLAERFKTTSILDYGCGKSTLSNLLPFPIHEYDPCIPGKDTTPSPADIVVCTDVLEHVEPAYLDNVLKDLQRCTLKVGFFTIHTEHAAKMLPNGKNAHLTIQGPDWWKSKLSEYFTIESIAHARPTLFIFVKALNYVGEETGHVIMEEAHA